MNIDQEEDIVERVKTKKISSSMGLKDMITSLFSGNNSQVTIQDVIEVKEHRLNLVKSEISGIIKSIDEHEHSYNSIAQVTETEIEKGYSEGEDLKVHISNRYNKTKQELLKKLSDKKNLIKSLESELSRLKEEFNISNISTGEKPPKLQCYGDSIVRNSKGDILLLLRSSDNDFQPNKWGLPGGKIEEGETPEEGTVRELKEETNLTAKSFRKVAEKPLDKDSTIYYYEVETEETEHLVSLDSEEHNNYCYMSVEEIKSRPPQDFIYELKDTLLDILNPLREHFQIIEKGYSEGKIDEDTFKTAKQRYREAFK